MRTRRLAAPAWALALGLIPLTLQTAAADTTLALYRLVEGSLLLDDCPVCGRPTIEQALRGQFQLRFLRQDPLFTYYALDDIALTAGAPPGPSYKVTGHGTYQVGGEVAVRQQTVLELQIDDGVTNRPCVLTNVSAAVNRLWPMLELSLTQSNTPFVQVYSLTLMAAPFREIWFSITGGLHSGHWQPPTNFVSGGDLISETGRIVKRNADLTANLGIMPPTPDLGLDAVDILPTGEIAFSTDLDVFSETLGPLSQGDLLSNRARVIRRNADLIQAFHPQPPVADMGLDAIQARDNGEFWFSTTTNFFSETLGTTVRHGDLLSSSGQIIKLNEDLLAPFQPADPKQDYGLDALYVWPSGEIWFSVKTGFQSTNSSVYTAGDLLSDQGYVVFRNLELTGAFAPLEDVSDFGLDALFVVTDVASTAPAPRLTSFRVDPGTGAISAAWDGTGHVFQLEAADSITGPWFPYGPITPDLSLEWAPPAGNPPQSFFRLRQW